MNVRLCLACIFLIAFVALGFVFLNGAFGSAWVAGGPPTSHKEAWEQRSLVLLSYSISSFVFATVSFLSVKNNRFKTYFNFFAVVILVVFISIPHFRVLALQDKCLDAGGSWVAVELKCIKN